MIDPASAAPRNGTRVADRIAIVGLGLIGSSIARAVRQAGCVGATVGYDGNAATRDKAADLGFCDEIAASVGAAVAGADLIVLATPLSAFGSLAEAMAPHLSPGAVVTDTGSVKGCVVRDVAPHLPAGVHLVPGHPIAGTEHSGPAAGFAELFQGRWALITPEPDTDPAAVAKVAGLWTAMGSMVEEMSADHHDRILGITSHLPHLIAYTIVGTATSLEEDLRQKVIQYSAGGFRDFTRIAGSDPVMWRDVFLKNREAVLDVVQRFTEDLTALQKAIRRGEADTLEDWFRQTRAIRRGVIEARQDDMYVSAPAGDDELEPNPPR